MLFVLVVGKITLFSEQNESYSSSRTDLLFSQNTNEAEGSFAGNIMS